MMTIFRFAGLLAVAAVLAAGCSSSEELCTPATNEDLRSLVAAIEEDRLECDVIAVRETDLASLDGLEGLADAFSLQIADNPMLSDFTALVAVHATSAEVSRNRAQSEAVFGALGGSWAVLDNGFRSVALQIYRDLRLILHESDLRELVVSGTGILDLQIHAVDPSFVVDFGSARPRAVRLQGASAAVEATDLRVYSVPLLHLGVYGTPIVPEDPAVSQHYEWLLDQGFEGTFEVCPEECDAYSSDFSCSDPGTWRTGCVVFGGT